MKISIFCAAASPFQRFRGYLSKSQMFPAGAKIPHMTMGRLDKGASELNQSGRASEPTVSRSGATAAIEN
jgi:hypothetical protein